jgi:SAF domain
MAVTTETTSSNGQGRVAGLRPRAPASGVVRRRQAPWMVTGVLLIVGCALAFAVASIRLGGGEDALVVARPIAAGQLISAADLQSVRVSGGRSLQPILASAEGSVVGHPAAVALVPGALLVPTEIGAPSQVTAGYDVVAAALKAGQFPPALAAGDRVHVVPVPSSTASGGPPGVALANPVLATVISVVTPPAGSSADAIVSLQVSDSAADQTATLAATGQMVLVQLPSGGGQ